MGIQGAADACPLCGSGEQMGAKAKPLYGHLVCKKCYWGFTNRRQIAFIADVIVWKIVLSAIVFTVGVIMALGGAGESAIGAMADGLGYALLPFFLAKDGFAGRSVGKAMLGVQVVDATSGEPIGFRASFKRNLVILIPFMPLVLAWQLSKGARVGDGWANTRVIWAKHRDAAPFALGSRSIASSPVPSMSTPIP